MFQLLQEDLHDCVEILRQISNESGMERLQLRADLLINERSSDIDKVYELCQLYIYYYDKINN